MAIFALGLAAAGLLSNCRALPANLSQSPPELRVAMTEFQFQHSHVVSAGHIVIAAENKGKVVHRLIIAPLPNDFPPVAQEMKGGEPRSVLPLAGIPDQSPGETGRVAVDLKAGRYGLFCLVVEPKTGRSHARMGMASELKVV